MKKLTLISSICLFVCALTFTSCDKTQDFAIKKEVLTGDNLTDIAAKIEKDKSLTREEMSDFINGLARLSVNRDSLIGKTVGEVIDAQANFYLTAGAENLKKASTQLEINLAHTFALQKLAPAKQDKNEFNIAVFDIKNNSGKDIKSIDGLIQLYNAQNQLVKIYTVQIEDGIKKDETKRYTRPYPHDPANEYDQLVRKGNLRPVWTARTIQYADGEKISVLNNDKKQEQVTMGK